MTQKPQRWRLKIWAAFTSWRKYPSSRTSILLRVEPLVAEPSLLDRLRATAPGHSRGAQLLALAAEFDEATDGYYADPQTVSAEAYLAAFRRALRIWSEVIKKKPLA
ncbi:hypothetical protein SAMN05519103_04966 [Rhizobiales bacterium GAS113]|nr:hypothetical protein SAMN05519103_04966 [Rhizobiales bacterium GAS113]